MIVDQHFTTVIQLIIIVENEMSLTYKEIVFEVNIYYMDQLFMLNYSYKYRHRF